MTWLRPWLCSSATGHFTLSLVPTRIQLFNISRHPWPVPVFFHAVRNAIMALAIPPRKRDRLRQFFSPAVPLAAAVKTSTRHPQSPPRKLTLRGHRPLGSRISKIECSCFSPSKTKTPSDNIPYRMQRMSLRSCSKLSQRRDRSRRYASRRDGPLHSAGVRLSCERRRTIL